MTMAASCILPATISSSELSAVSSMSCSNMLDEIRKRALDPLESQLVWPDVHPSSSSHFAAVRPEVVSDSEGSGSSEMPMVKKRKVVESKRVQKKYEPPVEVAKEMTKDEIAAWRREQRRTRNREPAAASRQRQKDRIVELEQEVSQWKTQYEDIMREISSLENDTIKPEETVSDFDDGIIRRDTVTPVPFLATSFDPISSKAAPVSPTQVVGSFLDLAGKEEVLLPHKMISRPAVKISGNCATPSFPDDDLMKPMICLSNLEKPDEVLSIKLDDPEDVSFLESLATEDLLPPVLDDDSELGNFLLDLF